MAKPGTIILPLNSATENPPATAADASAAQEVISTFRLDRGQDVFGVRLPDGGIVASIRHPKGIQPMQVLDFLRRNPLSISTRNAE